MEQEKLFDKWVSNLDHKDFCYLATDLCEFGISEYGDEQYLSYNFSGDYEGYQPQFIDVTNCFNSKEEAVLHSKKRLKEIAKNAKKALLMFKKQYPNF